MMPKNRWNLTYYKKMEHSTNKNQMVLSLQKFQMIKSKFDILKEIMNSIGLTAKTAEYHAKWIEKSQIFQVKRKKDVDSIFYFSHLYIINISLEMTI